MYVGRVRIAFKVGWNYFADLLHFQSTIYAIRNAAAGLGSLSLSTMSGSSGIRVTAMKLSLTRAELLMLTFVRVGIADYVMYVIMTACNVIVKPSLK